MASSRKCPGLVESLILSKLLQNAFETCDATSCYHFAEASGVIAFVFIWIPSTNLTYSALPSDDMKFLYELSAYRFVLGYPEASA